MGIGLSIAVLSIDFAWDWNRALIVVLGAVNAGLAAQTALLYGNYAYRNVPEKVRAFGYSPSAYWLFALAMLLLAGGVCAESESRSESFPASVWALPLLAGGMLVLTGWSIARLRAVRYLGDLDE